MDSILESLKTEDLINKASELFMTYGMQFVTALDRSCYRLVDNWPYNQPAG